MLQLSCHSSVCEKHSVSGVVWWHSPTSDIQGMFLMDLLNKWWILLPLCKKR
ncbi:hypothetical protein NC651_000138 [Populus alba x Populus x berolinensis]|nr:hypothetical protein NC651_000138 [Populus alba x Populus x berolinensis]